MKKTMVLILALLCLLCGCGKNPSTETTALETSPIPETTAPGTISAAEESSAPTEASEAVPPELDAFRRVLEGRMSIYRAASMEYIPTSKISLFFTVEEFPWEVVRFAVQDLDGDGVLDAVLEVSNYAGYVILQYQEDGTVTGQEIWYRAFQELKADGSYRGSGSSFNSSYWQYHFNGSCLLAERYEDENGTHHYWVNGEEADTEAFADFEEAQSAKEDAVWYESWEDYLKTADF